MSGLSFRSSGSGSDRVPAPCRLLKTADGRLVPEGDPDGKTLFAPHEGYMVSRAELEAGLPKPSKKKASDDK